MSSNYPPTGGFSGLAGYPAPQPEEMPDFQTANNNTANALGLNYENAQSDALQSQGPAVRSMKTKFDANGVATHTYELSDAAAQWLQKYVQLGKQTEDAYNNAASYVSAKRQTLEDNPILSSVGRLASLAASAYQAPGSKLTGLVRGAGAYGLGMFGETPEELADKEAGLRTAEVKSIAPIGGEVFQAERDRVLADREESRNARFETAINERERHQRTVEANSQVNTILGEAANRGVYVPGQMTQTASGFTNQDGSPLYSKDQVAGLETQAKSAADTYQSMKKQNEKNTIENEKNVAAAHADAQLNYQKQFHDLQVKWGDDPKMLPKINRLGQLGDDYYKTQQTTAGAVDDIASMYGAFQAAGAAKFQKGLDTVSPEQAAMQILGAFGSGSMKDGDGKDLNVTKVIAGMTGLDEDKIDAKTVLGVRNEIRKSLSAYQAGRDHADSVFNAHETLRKTLPADQQATYPSLRPYSQAPAPASAGAPATSIGGAAPPSAGPATQGPQTSPVMQYSPSTKQTRISYDGGQTWKIVQ